jgi:YVTN family beta-propeller protein
MSVITAVVGLIVMFVADAVGWRFSAGGYQPMTSFQAYVANTGDDSISVIDLATGAAIGSPISVGSGPSALAVSPDQQRVFVANSDANTVSVIDTQTRTVVATTALGQTSVRAVGVTVGLDGRRAFVTHARGNTVYTVNTASNARDDLFPMSGQPSGLVWTMKSGPYLYVSTPRDRGVTSVNLFETRRSRLLIRTGSQPFGIAISPDGGFVYVADVDESKVSVISTVTDTVADTFSVGRNTDSLAITPDGERLIVASLQSPEAHVLNPVNGAVIAMVPTGMSSVTNQPGLNRVAVSPDGLRAVVANEDDDTVSIIDLKTNAARAVVPVGNRPTGVVIVGKAAVCDPTPNAIDFGDVLLGQGSIDRLLSITNHGTETLQITRLTIDNPAFQIDGMPRSLAPRETARFIVRFVSNSLGEHVGALRLEANDPDPDRCIVRLRGVRRTTALGSQSSTHRRRQ